MNNEKWLEEQELADIGRWLCDPKAPAGWNRPYVRQLQGDYYLLIPGDGFILHLRINSIGHIDGFVDDTSGG